MTTSVNYYTTVRPLFPKSVFVRRVREFVYFTGGITSAMVEMFHLAHIKVNVIGDMSHWMEPGTGTLLVGDHRVGIEFAPLFSVLGSLGRGDVHLFAKPFAASARFLRSLGSSGDLFLPVVPGTLARDRRNVWNRDLGWRILQWHHLPTKRELVLLNEYSIERATALLESGHLVIIFPTGGVMNSAYRPWRRGLGAIVKLLSDEAQNDVRIVPFRFDDFSVVRVISSLLLQSYGIVPKPYEITLRLDELNSVVELLGNPDEIRRFSDMQISAHLRTRFIKYFCTGPTPQGP